MQRDDIQVNTADLEREVTLLGMAVKKGHAGVVRSLLAIEQIDINSEDRHGQTPVFHALSRAIGKLDKKIFKMILVKGGADLSYRDRRGFTPLIYAVRRREKGLTQILLSHQTSSTESRDWQGRTALWHTVRKRDADIIKLLLEKGADIAAQDIHGETPLYELIRTGRPSLTELLLRHPGRQSELDLNNADDVLPPLCLAAYLGNTEVVQLLLDHG